MPGASDNNIHDRLHVASLSSNDVDITVVPSVRYAVMPVPETENSLTRLREKDG